MIDAAGILSTHGKPVFDWCMKTIAEQNGRCFLCGTVDGLVIDHNHTTGMIRGLICACCNGGLPNHWENKEWRERALAYLARDTGLVYAPGRDAVRQMNGHQISPRSKNYEEHLSLVLDGEFPRIQCTECGGHDSVSIKNIKPLKLARRLEDFNQSHMRCRQAFYQKQVAERDARR